MGHGHSHGGHAHSHEDEKHSLTRSQCHGLHSEEDNVRRDFERSRRALVSVAIVTLLFMVGELVGGLYSQSLGILTDAAHLFSDFGGYIISLFALYLGQRLPTPRLSFGFYRAEILGAVTTILIIWLLSGILVYTAIERIVHPTEVDGRLMFILACLGACVNFINGSILFSAGHGHSHGPGGHDAMPGDHGHSHGHSHGHAHGGQPHEPAEAEQGQESKGAVVVPLGGPEAGELDTHRPVRVRPQNVNVRAALIHVLGDGIQALGVMVAGALIWYDQAFRIADPLCTFTFAILILFTTRKVMRQCIGVLMEAAPENMSPTAVESKVKDVSGVVSVHDLHIWSLSIGKPSLSVHVFSDQPDTHTVLSAIQKILADKFQIYHSTIQVETKRVSANRPKAISALSQAGAGTGVEAPSPIAGAEKGNRIANGTGISVQAAGTPTSAVSWHGDF